MGCRSSSVTQPAKDNEDAPATEPAKDRELFQKRRVLLELADHQMPVARRAEIELTEQRATTIGQLRSDHVQQLCRLG